MSTRIVSEREIHLVLDYGLNVASLGDAIDTSDLCSADRSVPGAAVKAYRDGDYLGCRIDKTMDLAQINTTGNGMSLAHAHHIWTYEMNSATLDDSELGISGSNLSAAVFDSFSISVTFPGKVLTHSGSSTVEGHTVTWTNAQDLFTGLKATAKDRPQILVALDRGWPYMLGAVVIVGLGAIVLRRRHRRAASGAVIVPVLEPTPPPDAPHDPGTPDPGNPAGEPRTPGPDQPPPSPWERPRD